MERSLTLDSLLLNNSGNNQPVKELNGLEQVTASHIMSLKSLAELLLNEVKLLENKSFEQATNLLHETDSSISLESEIEQYEIKLIRSALFRTRGHQRQAAKLLGIKFTTLNEKLKRYNIDAHTFKIYN